MADPNAADRARLYLGRAQQGTVLGRSYNFYTGNPTVPTSFTGNLALGATTGGPADFLINGVGPVLVPPETCDEPIVILQNVNEGVTMVVVTIALSNLLPTDTFVLFNSFGNAFSPSDIQSVPMGVELTFPGTDFLPSGTYALKVIREGDPECFGIEYGVLTVAGVACTVDATTWTLPGGVPFPPSVFPAPTATQLVGSGFLSCTIDVTVERVAGGGPPTLVVSALIVVDDNTLTFTVDGTPVLPFGVYEARVSCTDIPGCEDLADNLIVFQPA